MKTVHPIAFVICAIQLALWPSTKVLARTYTTSFPATENPISEGGKWINGQADGLLWANCMTTNNFVWGNDSRGVAYADPTALVTGTWGSNQTVTATVRVINQPTGNGCCSEVELRLRSVITANSNRGYEVLFSTYTGNDYVQVVTWHGPRGVQGVGFDYITDTSGHGAPVNGDVVSASISNSTIRVYKNGTLILTGVNTEWSDGNPGVGFYGDTKPNVGFSSFTATDGSGGTTNRPPIAVARATPTSGVAPLAVAFSSVGSSDPEGAALSYNWIFGDGASSTASNPSHTYPSSGIYSARLIVSDGTNPTTSSNLVITASPGPPENLRVIGQ